jgi:hypothetical protein
MKNAIAISLKEISALIRGTQVVHTLSFQTKSRHICITTEAITECMAVIAAYADDVRKTALRENTAITESEGRQYFSFLVYMKGLVETPPQDLVDNWKDWIRDIPAVWGITFQPSEASEVTPPAPVQGGRGQVQVTRGSHAQGGQQSRAYGFSHTAQGGGQLPPTIDIDCGEDEIVIDHSGVLTQSVHTNPPRGQNAHPIESTIRDSRVGAGSFPPHSITNIGSNGSQRASSTHSSERSLQLNTTNKMSELFEQRMLTVNTGKDMNIKDGFVQHLRSNFDKDGSKFTGEIREKTLPLQRLWSLVEPYHIAPNVTFDNKIAVLIALCEGRPKDRLIRMEGNSTQEAYISCWRILYRIAGNDLTQAAGLTARIMNAKPASHAILDVSQYVALIKLDTELLIKLMPNRADSMWYMAWGQVCALTESHFMKFAEDDPLWRPIYHQVPQSWYDQNPGEKFEAYCVYLDELAYRPQASQHMAAIMNARVNCVINEVTGASGAHNSQEEETVDQNENHQGNPIPAGSAFQQNAGQEAPRPLRCTTCGQPHEWKYCQIQTVKERRSFYAKNKKCFNCGAPGHHSKACRSKYRCQECTRARKPEEETRHHTSLCFARERRLQGVPMQQNDASASQATINLPSGGKASNASGAGALPSANNVGANASSSNMGNSAAGNRPHGPPGANGFSKKKRGGAGRGSGNKVGTQIAQLTTVVQNMANAMSQFSQAGATPAAPPSAPPPAASGSAIPPVHIALAKVGRPTNSFPELIVANVLKQGQKKSEPPIGTVRMMCDNGAGRTSMTRRLVREFSLPVKKLDPPVQVTGVTPGVLLIEEQATIYVQLKGSQVYALEALVLPFDEPWFAHVPCNLPNFVREQAFALADPDIVTAAGQQLPYDMLLAGDVMVRFRIALGHCEGDFALQTSYAGWIPRGIWHGGECEDPNLQHVSVKRLFVAQDKRMSQFEQEERDREYDELRMLELEQDHIQFHEPGTTVKDYSAMAADKENELVAFMEKIEQRDDGRMVVNLPKDPAYKQLITRNSRSAEHRLQATMRSMQKNPIIREGLEKTKDYMVNTGVLKRTTVANLDAIAQKKGRDWTELSFRGVYRPESKSTPVRLVISGDNKDMRGHSTNEWFQAGVNVLPAIPNVVTHLRMHKQFILADLSKAFYQVELSDEDSDLLVFRWPRLQKDGSVEYEYYVFARLAMGIKPAPAALNCCLRKLFRAHAAKHPEHAGLMKMLEDTAYVDDVPIVGNNDEETINNVMVAKEVAAKGKFDFVKFVSYPPHLAEQLGAEKSDKPFKVLGVGFDPETDQFYIAMRNIEEFLNRDVIRKRDAASIQMRAYDPLGLAAPAFFDMKRLRRANDEAHPKASWNVKLTKAETKEWHAATREIQNLSHLRVDRQLALEGEVAREYHGWSDASIGAIAACLHAKSIDKDGKAKVTLVAAKSKMAPKTKTPKVRVRARPDEEYQPEGPLTPPTNKIRRTEFNSKEPKETFKVNRAELNAAVLLVEMLRCLKPSLKEADKIYLWTDSIVLLTWIRNRRHTGVEFVDSRLRVIWDQTKVEQWRHCPTKDNPADIASRGMPASELIKNEQWFHGPPWLMQTQDKWPKESMTSINVMQEAVCLPCKLRPKATPCALCKTVITPAQLCQLFEDRIVRDAREWGPMLLRWTAFTKLQKRIKAWYAARKGESTVGNPSVENMEVDPTAMDAGRKITTHDLVQGERTFVRAVQQIYAHEEWKALTKEPGRLKDGLLYDAHQNLLMSRSRQYLDSNERLSPVHRDLIYVPTHSPLMRAKAVNRPVELMYRNCHLETIHGSISETYTRFRCKYWSSKARKIAKSVREKCSTCVLFQAKTYSAPEAPLPDFRCVVDDNKRVPFTTMGLDFLGPFAPFGTEESKKMWILVVSCTLTRAMILRAVQGLDLATFRHTFNTICFDYNLQPERIVTDRAETFQAAYNRLVWAHRSQINDPQFRKGGPHITWYFNASRAPWWGGFFERMMRMIKGKLARLFTMQPSKHFTSVEEFQEAVAWTQLVLNSRPISWNPSCGKYGQPVLALDLLLPRLPADDEPMEITVQESWLESASKESLVMKMEERRRWQHLLWNLFRDTYVAELRQRRAEKEIPGVCPLLAEGQVVLYKPPTISKEYSPMARLKWRLARVKKLHPGRDGRVRSVDMEMFKKGKWVHYGNQSIKHIAPFEVMLQSDEAKAQKLLAEQKQQSKNEEQVTNENQVPSRHVRYALRSLGPVQE